jgi:hypothetical protein
MPEVEDHEAAAEQAGPRQVVGDAGHRAPAKPVIRGGEVNEIARVDDEGSDVASKQKLAEGGDFFIAVGAGAPAAGAAGEDLEALAAQGHRVAGGLHQAAADWDMNPDAYLASDS